MGGKRPQLKFHRLKHNEQLMGVTTELTMQEKRLVNLKAE